MVNGPLQAVNKDIEEAVELFLSWNEDQSADPSNANCLFEYYGPENILERRSGPFRRCQAYEHLLEALCDADNEKYLRIHKGTPFYFLAWHNYEMGNYEKGIFYIDAAISEDIRKDPNGWRNGSAGMFLFLRTPENHPPTRIARHFINSIQSRLNDFNSISNKPPIFLDNFVKQFVEPLVEPEAATRSIITAFYSFILEFEDLSTWLMLRSAGQGSVEPFVTHLFKGGLIFESILKQFYDVSLGQEYGQLGAILNNDSEFRTHFPFEGNIEVTAKSVNDIVKEINKSCDYKTAFTTTAQLRNTTGHKLNWDDEFSESYESLFKQEISAIFYVIQRNLRSPTITTSITATTTNPGSDGTTTTTI